MTDRLDLTAGYRRGRTATASEQLEGLINGLDADTREDFEERAAIMEFCGEMPRVEAEAQAYALVTGSKSVRLLESLKE